MDANFPNYVEIGQYFMTEDTAEFSIPCSGLSWVHFAKRDEDTSESKGWLRRNTKIGTVLEVANCYFRLEFLDNEQETSQVQFEEFGLNVKAKSKKREPAGSSTRTIFADGRIWTDVEPRVQSPIMTFNFFVMEVYFEKMIEFLNFFLLGSSGQKPQGSWYVRLEWIASCATHG